MFSCETWYSSLSKTFFVSFFSALPPMCCKPANVPGFHIPNPVLQLSLIVSSLQVAFSKHFPFLILAVINFTSSSIAETPKIPGNHARFFVSLFP